AFPGIQWYREEYYRPQVEAYAARRGLSRAEVEAELDELMNQELVAHMVETWVSGEARYGSTIETLLQRLMDVLAAIARVLNRHGFHVLTDLVEARDADAILTAAFSGQMAGRPQQRRIPGRSSAAAAGAPRGLFTSQLDTVLSSLKPTDSVTADTLSKRGVKRAEIEARGLLGLLSDGKSAKVSDLREVAGKNRVEVREKK